MRTLVILFVGAYLLSSCVSSKKHKETLSSLQQEHEAQLNELQGQLMKTRSEKDALTLDLAKSEGANSALLATQDKLQERIDQLQAEVANIGSRASNQQQSLNDELSRRASEIQSLEQEIDNIRQAILRWENAQRAVTQELSLALQPFDSTLYSVDQRGGEVIVAFSENMLFRTGSTSRFEQSGIDALQAVSAILAKYPNIYIKVVGHTDNQNVARKSLDNWDYCLLRAGNVVKLLIDEFDLGANRLLPAGKGEYAPRTSNETSEGRAQNRRIELILSGGDGDLARELKREIEK